MLDMLELYVSYVKFYLKSRQEYRFGFWVGNIANFYTYFFTYATFWVMTTRFESLANWNFPEISFLYSLNLLTYALAGTIFWYSIYHLEDKVINGELDRYFLRPQGILTQLVCQQFGYTFLGQIAVTVVFLASNLVELGPAWNVLQWFYLSLALLGGVLIQAGAVILIGALSFWITRSRDVGDIVYYNLRQFVNYPLGMFPTLVKIVLTFVFPWAFINYYPAAVLLGKSDGTSELLLGLLTPLVGVVFFGLALFVFNRGLLRYTGAGN